MRTTNPRHLELVMQFAERVKASGDIVVGKQTGWYCVDCEEYKDDPAEAESPSCSIHRKPLKGAMRRTLLRLSRYQSAIEELVARDDFIAPASRRQEVRNFVAQGLRDFSISRVIVGIAQPDHPGHTFYVWFDALLGYLTALLDDGNPVSLIGLPPAAGCLPACHRQGHSSLPCRLLACHVHVAGLPVPQKVFGHGFLTREGQKMGKSLGNVLDPELLLERCGTDAVRWYLLRDIQFETTVISSSKPSIWSITTWPTPSAPLNRTSSMARKWFDDCVPCWICRCHRSSRFKAVETVKTVMEAMPNLAFKTAAEGILQP